ncbi:formylglycine-generating enzyme family protein [Gordonia sp. NPDC058843]|uniref:formylglycine-generating enzyme family protein n=1 Tax=Gordonia sp. NPDC058843 TaxID=3346648 RepID=UPI0036A3469A
MDVPAGFFAMGDAFDEGYRTDGETPVHDVELSAFSIDATAVTNAAFASFVAATGHRTDAETFGGSAVFHSYATAPGEPVPGTPWWLAVDGASWHRPAGPGSSIDDLADHPVVHVSHRDAQAYCAWAGRVLPTEAQWEYAARGGLRGARYPWGDEQPTRDDPRCNIFRGEFPDGPTARVGTIPARSFEPNGHGLYQCAGNVWEWCGDSFSARYYRVSDRTDPTGPARGSARVLRGGSHLCHDSYCHRYRVAARSHNTPESTASNIGFRTVGPQVG